MTIANGIKTWGSEIIGYLTPVSRGVGREIRQTMPVFGWGLKIKG